MTWQHRLYATWSDPVHKSHLNAITGEYGCPRRFQYDRNADPDAERHQSGVAALGNATHEVIATALEDLPAWGARPARDVEFQLRDELAKQVPIRWRSDDDPNLMIIDRSLMVVGLLADLARRVRTVVAVEPGFIAPFGQYWLSGHVDLVYEPVAEPGTLAIADWKTGSSKPHPLELDHGWEAGIYSAALRYGRFLSRGTMQRRELERLLIAHAGEWSTASTPTYGQFPSAIHHVHLHDYVPYMKAGSKQVSRVEDLQHYGYTEPTRHAYTRGQLRGGAWIPVRLTAHDLPRLAWRLRNVVGTVRMGRFWDRPGELCTRCAYAQPCLNQGYAYAEGTDEHRHLRMIAALGDDGGTP